MRCVLLIAMLAVMCFCSVVPALETDLQDDPEYQLQLRTQELELQQMEAKVEFERRMQEIKLQNQQTNSGRGIMDKEAGQRALLFLCAVVHVLLAVWVYQDIKQRNSGSGIWVAIAALAGLLGTLVYAVVRLGDKCQSDTPEPKPEQT